MRDWPASRIANKSAIWSSTCRVWTHCAGSSHVVRPSHPGDGAEGSGSILVIALLLQPWVLSITLLAMRIWRPWDTFECRSVPFPSRHKLGTIWSAQGGPRACMRGVLAGHNQHLKEFLDKAAKNPDMSESLGYDHSALSLFSLVLVSQCFPPVQVSQSAGRSKTRPLFYRGKRVNA